MPCGGRKISPYIKDATIQNIYFRTVLGCVISVLKDTKQHLHVPEDNNNNNNNNNKQK